VLVASQAGEGLFSAARYVAAAVSGDRRSRRHARHGLHPAIEAICTSFRRTVQTMLFSADMPAPSRSADKFMSNPKTERGICAPPAQSADRSRRMGRMSRTPASSARDAGSLLRSETVTPQSSSANRKTTVRRNDPERLQGHGFMASQTRRPWSNSERLRELSA